LNNNNAEHSLNTTLLFYSKSDTPEPWREAIAKAGLDIDFRVWPDIGKPEDVRYTLVWKPPVGFHKQFPNLHAILSLGAGVDALMSDPDLPKGVPIARLVDAGFGWQMAEYACYGALHFYRRMHEYAELQAKGEWQQLSPTPKEECVVGVMGLGVLGLEAVQKLRALGFPVIGWSKSTKQIEGVECYSGDQQRDAFLSRTRVLVNFLPLTPETEGLINASLLARLPKGACLINVARGKHVVEADLLNALNSGHIAGALLDVFAEEPLRADHPFWHHPRVVVTPHVAGVTMADEAAAQVIDNLRRLERGEVPVNVVNPSRGY
jgi:glyoxylate/hydroxypyruvate reductase A